jgi:hypothetical protein
LRSDFSQSRLVRLLGQWTPVDTATGARAAGTPAGLDVAERWSLWLNTFDAIALQSAHQSIRAGDAAPAPQRPRRAPDLESDLERVRGTLARAIAQDPLQLEGYGDDDIASAGFAPFQQRHHALQRQMEQMIAPLRDHVRQALAQASPAMRQLATLDAALEQVFARHQQQWLPAAVPLLQRRHEELRQAHQQALDATGQADDPARWRQPGGWLDTFVQDWRQALAAELDLRLQPVTGLVEAMAHELKNRT